jgi:hypothetical protein
VDEYYDDNDPFGDELIEAYCVRCKESVEVEFPVAVWTRKGTPATRGDCPICGGVVFRMGKTHMHKESERPSAVVIGDSNRRNLAKLPRDTVYVNFAAADLAVAEQLSTDLEKVGIAVWLHEHHIENDPVKWASGVHPALKECDRMVYVLSLESLEEAKVAAAWKFFRDQRKPIIIAQISNVPPPDPIRRSPRFDFVDNYKRAFREMVQALS